MGFRKTEKGNLIYDFDFTPTKLVPIPEYECAYGIEDENGVLSDIVINYQNPRHLDNAFAFASASGCNKPIIITNVCVIAALCKMGLDWEKEESEFAKSEHDEDDYCEHTVDYCDTQKLANAGIKFDIQDAESAQKFMSDNGLPRYGYDVLLSLTR